MHSLYTVNVHLKFRNLLTRNVSNGKEIELNPNGVDKRPHKSYPVIISHKPAFCKTRDVE